MSDYITVFKCMNRSEINLCQERNCFMFSLTVWIQHTNYDFFNVFLKCPYSVAINLIFQTSQYCVIHIFDVIVVVFLLKLMEPYFTINIHSCPKIKMQTLLFKSLLTVDQIHSNLYCKQKKGSNDYFFSVFQIFYILLCIIICNSTRS